MKSVYILANEKGLIKIGVSKNPFHRINVLEKQSGIKVKRYAVTEKCSNYLFLESEFKKHFFKEKLMGEWFDLKENVAFDYFEKIKTSIDKSVNEKYKTKTSSLENIFTEKRKRLDKVYTLEEFRDHYEYMKKIKEEDTICDFNESYPNLILGVYNEQEMDSYSFYMNDTFNLYFDILEQKYMKVLENK